MRPLIFVVLLVCVISMCSSGNERRRAPVYTPTEQKLKDAYDAQGIEYDEQMIRDDARAIEQLNSELK